MTQLTAAQCAQTVGVSKRTIQNNIKIGKLSATRDDNGFYLVDSSELMRAYPDAQKRAKESEFLEQQLSLTLSADETPVKRGVVDGSIEKQSLEVENKGLKKQIELLTQQLSKSESREEKLLEIAGSTQKLLENSQRKRKKFLGVF